MKHILYNNTNCFQKRDRQRDRQGDRQEYRGRGDINRFSRRNYEYEKKEKPKVYEYKDDDFPSL